LKIGDIIENRLKELASCAMRDGELWREPFSVEDERSCTLLEKWMVEANLNVFKDAVGNLFGRIPGRESGVIMAGSHRDSVKNGGHYDGVAGVVTSILAAGELYRELGRPQKTVDIVGFQEEEGSRFLSSYIGSKAVTGVLSEEELNLTDKKGVSLADVLKKTDVSQAIREDIELFLELHVEQGPFLEQQELSLGVVERIVGMVVVRITIIGQQNHAGTTPMNMRLDPMFGAVKMIDKLFNFVTKISNTATMTIGEIVAFPGISNVIPNRVCFTIDYRDGDVVKLNILDSLLQDSIAELHERGYQTEVEYFCCEQPINMSEKAVKLIVSSADHLGIPFVRMNSGAGHDAQIMARCFPTGMLFIPSHLGVSHAPEEYTRPEDLAIGFSVLKQALKTAAWLP